MTILFYYPFNKRTIPIDVPMFELKQRGHKIILLTLSDRGLLHELYEENEIVTYTHKKKTRLGQIFELIRFCKNHKIDVIHSHLQQTNIIASLASLLMFNTRVIPFRHHCKFHHLVKNSGLKPPIKEVIADRLINILTRQIIVPATAVKEAMIERENTAARKIKVIPYLYHFDQMQQISYASVEAIRAKYPAKMLIVMVSRMTPYKRHKIAFDAMMPLMKKGEDIEALIMDTGPEMNKLKESVVENNLKNKIHFLGFQTNILEYIAAADLILHPSLTDASNSVIKEASLFEKVVAVCDKVGDFNDYIVDGHNGFLIEAEKFTEESQKLILNILDGQIPIAKIGGRLRDSVLSKFSFNQLTVDKYEEL